jgi:hypothetical protein
MCRTIVIDVPTPDGTVEDAVPMRRERTAI